MLTPIVLFLSLIVLIFFKGNAFKVSPQLLLSKSVQYERRSVAMKVHSDQHKLKSDEGIESKEKKSAFDKVASAGLAGILAITVAEATFWALGVPLAELWSKVTTGDWINFATSEGQLKAAGFSFGYGSFATLILQYRVTLFAIPLVPIMEKYVVSPMQKALQKKGD